MATTGLLKATVVFSDGPEEVYNCDKVGCIDGFVAFFNEMGDPIALLNGSIIDSVICEYADVDYVDEYEIEFEEDFDKEKPH